MATLLGCIADDFTGATDLAGLLARSGTKVSLRIGVPEALPHDHTHTTSPFEVIALKSRTAPVAEAIAETKRALTWLRAAGAQRFFWKYCSTFDSTPAGNIGPVSEALMAELGAGQTIYCPAFPENGRSIYMGHLFVGQIPLAESPMKDHPLTPMRDSNLMRLLEPQVTAPVGLIDTRTITQGPAALYDKLTALASDGIAHVVVDAIADADLFTIASACRNMPLITGGSAVAMALPELYRTDGLLAEDAPRFDMPVTAQRTIILSGSCSAMTNRQVAHYRQTGAPNLQLDVLDLAERGAQSALDWLAEQDLSNAPLIYATNTPASVKAVQERFGVEAAGAMVEQAMAACATAAQAMGAQRIIVAGGETSGAVTQALAASDLLIGPEIAPGVPWTLFTAHGEHIALALKSGNFGQETFFTDAQLVLE